MYSHHGMCHGPGIITVLSTCLFEEKLPKKKKSFVP